MEAAASLADQVAPLVATVAPTRAGRAALAAPGGFLLPGRFPAAFTFASQAARPAGAIAAGRLTRRDRHGR